MKLIYISNARIPTEKPHGYQIAKMCEEFANSLNVELWFPDRNNNITESIFNYYGIKNNFQIKKIKIFDFLKFNKYLGRAGYWLHLLLFLIKLLFINIKKDNIIYTRDAEIAWLFKIRGYKTIFEAHSWPESKRWLYKFLIKDINKIIVITKGLKNVFLKYNLPENRILVAPDGVDLEKFNIDISKKEARRKLNLSEDTKIFMYAGLFDKWKGYLTLLQAVEYFNKKEAQLVMIGGEKEQIEKLKKEYPDVIFLGYLPYKTLPINQQAADVLILPNSGKTKISKFYTSPLKLFSYMSSQRPIVASDLPSIREVLGENNAILVEPDNPESLAIGIKKVLHNRELGARIAKQAYVDVKKYTWTKRAENILEFIIK
ncbi:MAG: glycosyltransferase family 4 protein [Patescibacteria group bacterium]